MDYIKAFALYVLVVYVFKFAAYPKSLGQLPAFVPDKQKPCLLVALISPDYWFACRFKNRIKTLEFGQTKKEAIRRFIVLNNHINVLTSLVFLLIMWISHETDAVELYRILGLIAFIRFLSRSYEILYAFGRDVFQEAKNESGLTKHQRIELAVRSYFEVFLYSAAAYIAIFPELGPMQAIVVSLSVGTLTNVGVSLNSASVLDPLRAVVFVQVFCTLSLVVFSLASYLSRRADA